jgi:lysophospholipase L1-like esterase
VALTDIHGHAKTLKFILVELGANDLRSFATSPKWMADTSTLLGRVDQIVATLKTAAPGVPILIANFYNPYAAETPSTIPQAAYVNGGMAELAQLQKVTLVDFASAMGTNANPGKTALCRLVDCPAQGIHPTQAGAVLLAQAVLSSLQQAAVIPNPSPSPSPSPSPATSPLSSSGVSPSASGGA